MNWKNYYNSEGGENYLSELMSPMKQHFLKEFNTLDFVLRSSSKIFIIGHSNPDADAVGSVVALERFIKKHYKGDVTIGCYDAFPASLEEIIPNKSFSDPTDLNMEDFDVVIGCDSVDRGFNEAIKGISDTCVTVVVDHHHDTVTRADIYMNDAGYSSTCEILYSFFRFTRRDIDKDIATALLAGIIFDTGTFQHANTSSETLTTSSELVKKGASISKINKALFADRNIETLNLWGRALEKTKFHKDSGLATAAITGEDLQGHMINSGEISTIASMLTTVPDVKASLIVYQAEENTIKGSLRSEKHSNVDVSEIAHTLGGGGHKLASGFSMPGRIITTEDGGWEIV